MAERAGNVTVNTTNEQENKIGSSDDKCIGNRRIRTVILCLILLAFSIFAAGYLSNRITRAKDRDDVVTGCNTCEEAGDSRVHGANLIFAGLIFIMFFIVVTMVVAVLPACDPNTVKSGRIPAGLGLIFGATLYVLGWIWYIGSDKDINYNFLSSEEQEDQDAICMNLQYMHTCVPIVSLHIFRCCLVWRGFVIFCDCNITRCRFIDPTSFLIGG